MQDVKRLLAHYFKVNMTGDESEFVFKRANTKIKIGFEWFFPLFFTQWWEGTNERSSDPKTSGAKPDCAHLA